MSIYIPSSSNPSRRHRAGTEKPSNLPKVTQLVGKMQSVWPEFLADHLLHTLQVSVPLASASLACILAPCWHPSHSSGLPGEKCLCLFTADLVSLRGGTSFLRLCALGVLCRGQALPGLTPHVPGWFARQPWNVASTRHDHSTTPVLPAKKQAQRSEVICCGRKSRSNQTPGGPGRSPAGLGIRTL